MHTQHVQGNQFNHRADLIHGIEVGKFGLDRPQVTAATHPQGGTLGAQPLHPLIQVADLEAQVLQDDFAALVHILAME